MVKLTFRDEVSSLIIYISGDIGLFTVSKVTNCGKFRNRIDIISKSYSYLNSAISLWVKHTHLVALQLSNTGLSIGFITSNKLINQSLHFWFLDRARKIRKLHCEDDYKWVALNICGGNKISNTFTVSKLTNCGKFKYWIDIINKTYSYMKSAITLWIKHAHLIVLQLSNSGLSVEFIASNNLISSPVSWIRLFLR